MSKEKNNKKKTRRHRWVLFSFGSKADKEYLIENLAMLLSSGMNIIGALQAVQTELHSRRVKFLVQEISDNINSGYSLSRALEESDLLPEHVIALIKIGEESGRLPENLQIIATSQQKDRLFKSKVRSALMYPVFVLALVLIMGVGIAWFILPRLSLVFSQLNLELPLITKVLIEIGKALGLYGIYIIPSLVLFIGLFIYFTFFNSRTKHIGQGFLFYFPAVKKLIREVELARAGFVLGTLLEAGLPIVEALDSLAKATTFPIYRKFYIHLLENIKEGNSFRESFQTYRLSNSIIPVPIQQLIVASEQAGKLSGTLRKIGDMYEAKIDTTTKNLTVILEPLLLVIVWIGVVGVALAVVMPIYSLVGGLNG